jgi:NADPH-dependent glutamate synthase beta subunit-like oxidoreductase
MSMRRREFLSSAFGVAAATGVGNAGVEAGAKSYSERLETPVVARYQVVVADGGPSGVIAAAAAARSGASTLLITREKIRAEENYARAEQHFRQARETVDRFGARLAPGAFVSI